MCELAVMASSALSSSMTSVGYVVVTTPAVQRWWAPSIRKGNTKGPLLISITQSGLNKWVHYIIPSLQAEVRHGSNNSFCKWNRRGDKGSDLAMERNTWSL